MTDQTRLTDLRYTYGNVQRAIDAITQAHTPHGGARGAAAKTQAQELAKQLHATTNERQKEITAALQAMNSGYLEKQAEIAQLRQRRDELTAAIQRFYNEGHTLDWTPRLQWSQTALYDSWGGGGRKPGYLLITPVELCQAELDWIAQHANGRPELHARRDGDGYRIVIRYSYYRGCCYAEMDGKTVLERLPIANANGFMQNEALLNSLEILQS